MGHTSTPLLLAALVTVGACATTAPTGASADDLVTRSAASLAAGRSDLALADLDAAVRADPGHAQARYDRAMLRHGTGQAQGAMEDIDVAVTLRPMDPTVRSARCVIQVAAERSDAGLKNCQYALVMPGASTAAVQQAYGQALQSLGREQDAQVAFQAAEAARPAADPAPPPTTAASK